LQKKFRSLLAEGNTGVQEKKFKEYLFYGKKDKIFLVKQVSGIA
jgi:hypothetical protein